MYSAVIKDRSSFLCFIVDVACNHNRIWLVDSLINFNNFHCEVGVIVKILGPLGKANHELINVYIRLIQAEC